MIAHGSMWASCGRTKLDPARFNLAEPGFTFYRVGRTETKLPDGRIVYIGGEHEDYPFPDFFIYNDVVVIRGHSDGRAKAEAEMEADLIDCGARLGHDPRQLNNMRKDGMEMIIHHAVAVKGAAPEEIDIYGYPTDVFLPTDFHTATYYKDETSGNEYIYIIGGLGYKDSPHRHTTLTHRLDLSDFSIRRMETSGDAPPPVKQGYAKKHGDVIVFVANGVQYMLSLKDMRWSEVPEWIIFTEERDFGFF
jgi:hypothetical protein